MEVKKVSGTESDDADFCKVEDRMVGELIVEETPGTGGVEVRSSSIVDKDADAA